MTNIYKLESLLDHFIESDPDRAERWLESTLAKIELRKRLAHRKAVTPLPNTAKHPAEVIDPDSRTISVHEQPAQKPVSLQWLAEMILSDCGHSSNYTPLLDRVMARIEKYERANTGPQAREPEQQEQTMKSAATAKEAIALFPEVAYWYNEFLEHNTVSEQPAQQEPIGYWLTGTEIVEFVYSSYHDGDEWQPLYARPQAREPLTDEEIKACLQMTHLNDYVSRLPMGWKEFASAIEAAHGIKGDA